MGGRLPLPEGLNSSTWWYDSWQCYWSSGVQQGWWIAPHRQRQI